MMWWHKHILKHNQEYTDKVKSLSGYVERWVQCSCGKGWWVEIDTRTDKPL